MFTTPLIIYFLLFYCSIFPLILKTTGYCCGFTFLEKHGASLGFTLGILLSYVSHFLVLYIAKQMDKKRDSQKKNEAGSMSSQNDIQAAENTSIS